MVLLSTGLLFLRWLFRRHWTEHRASEGTFTRRQASEAVAHLSNQARGHLQLTLHLHTSTHLCAMQALMRESGLPCEERLVERMGMAIYLPK